MPSYLVVLTVEVIAGSKEYANTISHRLSDLVFVDPDVIAMMGDVPVEGTIEDVDGSASA